MAKIIKQVGEHVKGALKPHLPPWLGAGALALAGPVASLRWEDSTAATFGLTLTSVALSGVTWFAGKSTSTQRQIHATVTTAAGSSWFTYVAVGGVDAPIVWDSFFMGGAALALSWNIRIMLRRNDDNSDASGENVKGQGLKPFMDLIGMAKAKAKKPKVEPNKVRIPYAIEPGQGTNKEGADVLEDVASAARLPVTAVRHVPDPEDSTQGEWVITPTDHLKEITWYPGPSSPGGSIAEPIVIGIYDDGEPIEIKILKALHILIMGMTGSGKTEAAMDFLAEIFSRKDVAVWLSDHVKQGQDLACIFPACDWVALSVDETEAQIEAFRQVLPARTKWLGSHKYREWTPSAAQIQDGEGTCNHDGTPCDHNHTCRPDGTPCYCAGIEFLFGWFEEAGNTLANIDDSVFTTIAQEARSAGASLIVSMQRASGYQISTDTRSSIPSALCLGVKTDTDAGFALPEEVLDAGAAPHKWGNRKPGYLYWVGNGTDEERHSNPARSYRNDIAILEAITRDYAPYRMKISKVTADAAAAAVGDVYTDRTIHALPDQPLPEAAAKAIVQGLTDQLDSYTAPDEEDSEMEQLENMSDEALMMHIEREAGHIDEEADMGPAEPGYDTPFEIPDEGTAPTTQAERDALLAEALKEMQAKGRMYVGPKDLVQWAEDNQIGGRSWLSKAFKRAWENGLIKETSKAGRYQIVAPGKELVDA